MKKTFDIDLDALNIERREAGKKLMKLVMENCPETSPDEAYRFADSMSRVLVLAGAAIRKCNEILGEDDKMLNEDGIKLCVTEAIKIDTARNDSIFKK